MDEAQKNYLNLLKRTFEKRQEFLRYDKNIFEDYKNKLTVHCAALSRNQELFVCGCSKSVVILYDLIAKKSCKGQHTAQIQYRKHPIITVAFSYYYDYVITGNTMGDLFIFSISINTQGAELQLDLMKYVAQYHGKTIQSIYHSSVDHLLTIGSDRIRVSRINDFIQYENAETSPNFLSIDYDGITASVISFHQDHYYLYCGKRNNQILQFRSSSLYTYLDNSKLIHQIASQNSTINKIEVSSNQLLLAVSYQIAQQDGGNLLIIYIKKRKQIYSSLGITKDKISQLLFFNDNSHLCFGSWDGTFQILNIEKKEILAVHTHKMHDLGIVSFFPTSDSQEFPNLVSVGHDHIVKKHQFGNIKEQLFEYIPFIFWVEQRIRQDLQFQSELHAYQKLLYVESMGVDGVKMRELNQGVFGFEKFQPLYKRILDYFDYSQRSKALFKRYERELQSILSSQRPPHKLPPLELQGKNESIEVQSILGSSQINFSDPTQILKDQFSFTFTKITKTINLEKVKIFVLQKCSYLFDNRFDFKQQIYEILKKMRNLKYLDLSYNSLNLDDILQLLEQLNGVTVLDFLSLAHNNIGEGQSNKSLSSSEAIMDLLDEVTAISLRSNKLKDIDGEAILNQIKHFKKLKILDISGNLDFKDKTLQALQRITILQNKLEFSQNRNDFLNFFSNLKLLQEKEQQQELEEQSDQLDREKQSVDNNEERKLVENLPEPSVTIDRQSSNASETKFMSLQLLCIQFQTEVCEQAMKTATDFLVQRKITNLYIYVVDNKQDDVWETSISIFYTRDLKKIKDFILGCIGGILDIIVNCFEQMHKNIRYEGYYCIKRMFCTNYFLWKYLACAFCTFLTTNIGKFIVKIFGVEQSYFEYNPLVITLEDELKNKRYVFFTLFGIYFFSYYFVVVFLPLIFVDTCQESNWAGHLIYLSFAVYSFFVEGYLGLIISNLKVTTNEYTDGNSVSRYFYIIKDLLISQLTKFELYTCVCFIVIINSCSLMTEFAWIGVAIIGLNLLFDLALIIRYLLVPYIYKQKLSYIDVFTQFSTLYQMNIATNLLEKWSEQNTIFIFFLNSEVPQKVVVSILKSFFQDIPLLLLQAIYLGLNPYQPRVNLLVLSLIIVAIHCVFSIIKMLSITRAAKVNEDIVLQEVQKAKYPNKTATILKELKQFVRKFTRKITVALEQKQLKNENAIIPLIDLERAALNRPHTQHDLENYLKQKSSRVMPARKGITQIGNKIQRVNPSKNSKKQAEEFYKMISVKASLDIFGDKIKSWKLEQEIPLDIVDALLTDVPRQSFAIEQDWDFQQQWFGNIKISSLSQLIAGFKIAYQNFQNRNIIDILDLGCGSGYVSFVLASLALRRNPKSQITVYMVDHYEEAEAAIKSKIEEFQNLSKKCKFQFYKVDCLDGIDFFKNQKFDFIFMGCAATKWRINKYIIPYLKDDGQLFGYETFSSLQQKPIQWNQLQKQYQLVSHTYEQYGIMEPLAIQTKDLMQNNQQNLQKEFTISSIKFYNECSICGKNLSKNEKQFINHYWGECVCFVCGNDDLEQQGEEIDIEKIKYRSNLIYYSGENCKISQIKLITHLHDNLVYPSGHKSGTLREYSMNCSSCGQKRSFGFQYKCLICTTTCYCNSCGLQLMRENTMKYHAACSSDHPLLRIIYPQKTQKGKR